MNDSPASLTKLMIDTDFSETGVLDVAQSMGVDTRDLMVFISRSWAPFVREVADKLGCTIILVPDEIMHRDAWAAHHKQRHEFGMWSAGA